MAPRLLAGLMGVLVIAIGIRYLWSGLTCRPSTRHGPVRARDGPRVRVADSARSCAAARSAARCLRCGRAASGHQGAAAQLSHLGEELAVERLFLRLDDLLYRASVRGPGFGLHLVQRRVG
jgi:hypothetical protein